ncbi:MAG: ADP-ribosylglycohydrolase family protein [Opitutales bacterium]|nr:ADP-ribosylglycohydrolase family protein [Opitutales bacterium]
MLDVNFLDVGNAPLYPAFLSVLIANGLNGKPWEEVRLELTTKGVGGLVDYEGDLPIEILEPQIAQALELSERFRQRADYPSKENCSAFVKSLYKAFARGTDYEMCSCEEMLSVPLAIADYSMELGLQAAVENGVNYGRDNDTVASFVATLVGAYRGIDDLRPDWIRLVQKQNPGVDIAELSEKLSHLSPSIR